MQTVSTVLLLTLSCCFDLDWAHGNEFAYNGEMGPDHWGEQFSGCDGKHQSPININVLKVVRRSYPPLNLTKFVEMPKTAELYNNGHTVLARLEFADGPPTISGGPLDGDFAFEQLHFHWGDNDTVGSEDRINNVSFPAELHMVFRNMKYSTFADAVIESNGVAVLAGFYAIQTEDNPNYAEFTDLLEHVVKPDMVAKFLNPPRLNDLISHDYDNYYTYTGSLTTPPCSEDVTWIDFTEPIKISAEQIERFRRLYTYDNKPLTHNFRPVQPLNNRTVFSAFSLYLDTTDMDDLPQGAIPFVDNLVGSATMQRPTTTINIVIMLLLCFLTRRITPTIA